MKSEVRILYEITQSYWVRVNSPEAKTPEMYRVISSGKQIKKLQLFTKAGLFEEIVIRHMFLLEPNIAILSEAGFPLIFQKKRTEFKARYFVEQFRRKGKQQLLANAMNSSAELREIMRELTSFIFSDHFSVYSVNRETGVIGLVESSFNGTAEYQKISETNGSLRSAIDNADAFVNSGYDSQGTDPIELAQTKTVSRFVVRSPNLTKDSNFEMLISFYSPFEKFQIRKDTYHVFKNILEVQLSRIYSSYIARIHEILTVINEFRITNNLHEYFNNCCNAIAGILGWEACSIFMQRKHGDTRLVLHGTTERIAVKDYNGVFYDTDETSMTGTVFCTKRVAWSYDIQSDPANSKRFNETTPHPATNWVGLPVVYRENSESSKTVAETTPCLGVLRVKNRIENGVVQPFNTIDVGVLKDITDLLARQMSAIEEADRIRVEKEKKLKGKEEEYRKISEFIKLFRHEIRNPLNVFTGAPRELRETFLAELKLAKENTPKRISEILDDLTIVGSRLSYVANVFTFEAEELVREKGECKLAFEVIFPVTSFAVPYARDNKRKLSLHKSTLDLPQVFCDPFSCSMVFHILIDNAIKYSNKHSEIAVFGSVLNDKVSLVVESYGLAIDPEETEDIFTKYYRGRHVKKNVAEGSGIGLYLARSIMKSNNAELKLTSVANPTRFEMVFDRYKLFRRER